MNRSGGPGRSVGRLFGVGVGPGDPELLTCRAVRVLEQVQVVAHFAARRRPGNSLQTIRELLRPDHIVERLEYPVTTEPVTRRRYDELLDEFYTCAVRRLAAHLDAGRDVAVISEGDPMFYGSYMHVHQRMVGRYPVEVVPGVTAFSAASAAAGTPVVASRERFTVVPAIAHPSELSDALQGDGGVVIMKVGRHLRAVSGALDEAGRSESAVYVERVGFPDQRIAPLSEAGDLDAPYLSLVLVPGRRMLGGERG